jgi:hypothetical protein
MTPVEAIQKIRRQYPDITEIQIADYQFGFESFNPINIEKIIDAFQDSYEYQNPPKWAYFSKLAFKLGIHKKQRALPFWRKCTECKTHYSHQGKQCPKCGNRKALIVVAETKPNDFMFVQENCHICKIYDRKNDDRNQVHGFDCNKFGMENNPRPFPYCQDCECKACCLQAYKLKGDQWEYKEQLKLGRYKEPWIKAFESKGSTVKKLSESKKVN